MSSAFDDVVNTSSEPTGEEDVETYFGVSYDHDEYNKPWRDTDFLTQIYESDHAPTYQEIADKIGCSEQTVHNWMPDDAQRGGPGLPYEDIAMFSGGYDSLVATHYSMEQLDCDAVLHINTQTGIDENQEFVERVCEQFGWPLEIVTPNKTLEEFAKEYGFPKAPAHSWIYRYLKEHPLASFVTDLQCDKPSFYTGVRKDESSRRMENVTVDRQEMWGGRWWWEAPIAEFTAEDIVDYMIEHGLPRNPVVETIGRSGECFCGAYADRFSELVTLQENYPDHYEWIQSVESDVQEDIGTDEDHCYWGTSGMSSDELQELMESEDGADDMTMCVDCEGEGHREFGHDQDPTYESIYVAGPREGYCDYYNELTSYDTTTEWVNPFEQNEYENEQQAQKNVDEVYGKDIDSLRQCDGIVVRRISDYNLCGASIEAALAVEKMGIPCVVYNDADSEVPLMLEAIATEVVESSLAAAQAIISTSRKKLTEIDGESVIVE